MSARLFLVAALAIAQPTIERAGKCIATFYEPNKGQVAESFGAVVITAAAPDAAVVCLEDRDHCRTFAELRAWIRAR